MRADVFGSSKAVDTIGDHPIFGEVWYHPTAPFNLISQQKLRENGWYWSTDELNTFLRYRHHELGDFTLNISPTNGYWTISVIDLWDNLVGKTSANADISVKAAIIANVVMKHYTAEQRRRAETAIQMHYLLNHPSDKALRALLASSSMINCPITHHDLVTAREMYGPCKECAIAKPHPHKGTHSSYDRSPCSGVGEHLHCDIVSINKALYLLLIDDATNYMQLMYLERKDFTNLWKAFNSVIHTMSSYGYTVKQISADSEVAIASTKIYLESTHSVQLHRYLPGEHEKVSERSTRILRERMRVKLTEIPYKLAADFYYPLAVYCADMLNSIPNSKTVTHSPKEVMTGEKINYNTDMTASFGSAVLCASRNIDTSPGNIGIVLGREPGSKGGIIVYVPGQKKIKIRRALKSMPTDQSIINHMNDLAANQNSDDKQMLIYKETGSVKMFVDPDEDYNLSEGITVSNDYRVPDDRADITPVHDHTPVHEHTPVHPVPVHEHTPVYSVPVHEPPVHPVPVHEAPVHIVPAMPPNMTPPNTTLRSVDAIDIPLRSVAPARVVIAKPTEPTQTRSGRTIKVPDRFVNNIHSHIAADIVLQRMRAAVQYQSVQIPKAYMNSIVDREVHVLTLQFHELIKTEHKIEAEAAALKEFEQLVKTHTWRYLKSIAEREPSQHQGIEPCKILMKDKRNALGEFLLWKARLVNGGHRTDPLDYDPFEKTSPTANIETIMMQLTMAVQKKMFIESFDVPGAYLHATLGTNKKHVMRIPKSLVGYLVSVDPSAKPFVQKDGSMLVELQKSLYGLPEAGKLWNQYLSKVITDIGYVRCDYDHCLFTKKVYEEGRAKRATISIHVDDCLLTYDSVRLRDELYSKMDAANLKDLVIHRLTDGGSITHLGMLMERRGDEVRLSQPGYIDDLLKDYRPDRKHPSPMEPFVPEFDANKRGGKVDQRLYLSKLMRIYYLALRTRPDIMAACAYMSTRSADPRMNDMKALDRIVGYIHATRHLQWTVRGGDNDQLSVFVDSAFGVHDDRKSHTGKVITVGWGGFPIAVKSHKQKVVSTSSCEAELIGLHDCLDLVMWCREIMNFIGATQKTTKVHVDATSTITQAHLGRPAQNTKRWIDIKYFWITQLIELKLVQLVHLQRDKMLADPMASVRIGASFRSNRDKLLLLQHAPDADEADEHIRKNPRVEHNSDLTRLQRARISNILTSLDNMVDTRSSAVYCLRSVLE